MSNDNLNIQSNATPIPSTKEDFSYRLGKLIEEQGISQNEFARQIGSTSAFVSNMMRGKSKPGLEFLQKIAEFYKVSLDWLILGKGSIHGDSYINSEWHNSVFLRLILAKQVGDGNIQAQILADELLGNFHMADSIVQTERETLLEQISYESNIGPSIVSIYNQVVGISNIENRNMAILKAALDLFQATSDDPLAELIKNSKKNENISIDKDTENNQASSQVQIGTNNKMAGNNFYEK